VPTVFAHVSSLGSGISPPTSGATVKAAVRCIVECDILFARTRLHAFRLMRASRVSRRIKK
jgi:hypothetical protein